MRLLPFVFVALVASSGSAQPPDPARPASGATVSGLVYDSVAGAPLAGAIVQLVASDSLGLGGRTVYTDSLGRYTFADVPDGRYLLGFFHPVVDSLGLPPKVLEILIAGRQPVRADLAIPSAARLSGSLCGTGAGADPGAMLIGVVRDARDRAPVIGVTVTGEWIEIQMSREGFNRRISRVVETTGTDGRFTLCNVPSPGAIAVIASLGADSTDLIELHVPDDGFLRRDLYLGAARIVGTGDSAARGDSAVRGDTAAARPVHRRTGEGSLSGRVVESAGAKPLAGARVTISGGPETRANERGEWTLALAPAGTRILEVRAVGYYPERTIVDVVTGAAPIHTALAAMDAVLEPVRITEARVAADRIIGFAERRRSGMGRYITAEDIALRQPGVSSDLFLLEPALRLDRMVPGEVRISMRSMFGGECTPAVYIDGKYMRGLSAGDIDDWVTPTEIAGMEIYVGNRVPPEFRPGLGGCGSIVIWRRIRADPVEGPLQRRIMKALGVGAFGLGVGAVILWTLNK